MDPIELTGNTLSRWLPRVSGDGPGRLFSHTGTQPAAPRERGWTVDIGKETGGYKGCPA